MWEIEIRYCFIHKPLYLYKGPNSIQGKGEYLGEIYCKVANVIEEECCNPFFFNQHNPTT